MPKLKQGTILPDEREDSAISAAALSDPDAQPLTDVHLASARPVGSGTKVQVTMRFDEDIVDAFKKEGDGWQSRMNGALREWLSAHR